MSWAREMAEAGIREAEASIRAVAIEVNVQRKINQDAEKLYDLLISSLKKEIEGWNKALKAEPRRQIGIKESQDSIRFIAKSYKQAPVGNSFEELSSPFYLDINFRRASAVVEYSTDPEIYRGSLVIDVGSKGSLAFFQNSEEVGLEQASEIILIKFLDYLRSSWKT